MSKWCSCAPATRGSFAFMPGDQDRFVVAPVIDSDHDGLFDRNDPRPTAPLITSLDTPILVDLARALNTIQGEAAWDGVAIPDCVPTGAELATFAVANGNHMGVMCGDGNFRHTGALLGRGERWTQPRADGVPDLGDLVVVAKGAPPHETEPSMPDLSQRSPTPDEVIAKIEEEEAKFDVDELPLLHMKIKWSGDTPYRDPRRFVLVRHEDVTGMSGTGVVAQGVEWSDGNVNLRWLGDHPTSVGTYDRGMESVEHLHCHGGKTSIVWIDDANGDQLDDDDIPHLKPVDLDEERAKAAAEEEIFRLRDQVARGEWFVSCPKCGGTPTSGHLASCQWCPIDTEELLGE
jgi:hypothetical protein